MNCWKYSWKRGDSLQPEKITNKLVTKDETHLQNVHIYYANSKCIYCRKTGHSSNKCKHNPEKITIEQNNLRKHQPRNPQKNQTNSSKPKEKRTLKRKETDEDPLKSQNRRITQTDTPTKPQNNPNTARYLF